MAIKWKFTVYRHHQQCLGMLMAMLAVMQRSGDAQATDNWWIHQRCMTQPPNPANGAFPGASYVNRHWGATKRCKGMPSGSMCVGRCNPGFSGMPTVKCWMGAWQPIQGGCVPKPGPQAGPCGSPGDDYCMAIPNAINGSCTAVPPYNFMCKCVSGYAWNNETRSCLVALAIAVGTETRTGSSTTNPYIVLWDGAQWKPQAIPAGVPSSLTFTSVALVDSTTAFAAGSDGTTGYLLKWDGSTWAVEQNSGNRLQVGAGAFVALKDTSAFTLGGPLSVSNALTSWIGPQKSNIGETWQVLNVSAAITSPGSVTALSRAKGANYSDDCGMWATTQYQVLRYNITLNGPNEWVAMTQPNPNTYTAVAAACCNPYTVWVATSHPMVPASLNRWDFKGGYLVGQTAGPANPPFAQGYAFNGISASDGSTAWAVGAGMPDNVGVILGFNNKTQAWPLSLDGRLFTPKVPVLRGSFTRDKNSAVAVGDAGAVVWWDGISWKPAQSIGQAGSTRVDLRAVAL